MSSYSAHTAVLHVNAWFAHVRRIQITGPFAVQWHAYACGMIRSFAIMRTHSYLSMLQDLYDSIAAGDYPEWKLMIQTMEVADEDKFDFDPLDDTKTWPEDIFPLQPVGRMVLNKNPDNFFNENEQVAYCPALIVPGD